jgi:hypothetical protein
VKIKDFQRLKKIIAIAGEISGGFSAAALSLKQQKFKSQGSAQRFLAAHAAFYNTFNIPPHLLSRRTLRSLRALVNRAWDFATVAA